MDFGYPQRTEPEILKMYITQEGVKSQVRHSQCAWESAKKTPLNEPVRNAYISSSIHHDRILYTETYSRVCTPQASAVAPQQLSMQVTGATTWRRDGIRYKKNELFLDVIETVNMLMSAQGTVWIS